MRNASAMQAAGRRARRLRHRATTAYRRLLGLPAPIVHTRLAGVDLRVREGGVREPEMDDAWIVACAQHASNVFDVGANMGQAALMMLLSPSVKQVTLVEANERALTVAAENLIMNGLARRARFVTAFADESDGEEMRLWTVETGQAGSMYRERATTASRRNASILVPTITLDSLMIDSGVADFVKVDVEGAEMRVLEGATGLAAHQVTRFLVEMHLVPGLTMNEHFQLLSDWCDRVGYAGWHMPTLNRLPLPSVDNRRCHVLLQPAEWSLPPWLSSIPMWSAVDLPVGQNT